MLRIHLPALLAAGLAMAPATAQDPRPVQFTATGNEPGWSLTVLQDNATYLGNYGGTRISGRQSAPEPTETGTC